MKGGFFMVNLVRLLEIYIVGKIKMYLFLMVFEFLYFYVKVVEFNESVF